MHMMSVPERNQLSVHNRILIQISTISIVFLSHINTQIKLIVIITKLNIAV